MIQSWINSFDKEFKSKEICNRLIFISKQLNDKDLEQKYTKELEELN